MLCPKEQYWDDLLQKCMPCMVACHPLRVRTCTNICGSMDCRKHEGFYYDPLLGKCIDCKSVCGQHPRECVPFCRKDPPTPLPISSALQAVQCKLDAACDQRIIVYLVLGVCFGTLLFSLLLTWVYFRKRREEVTCNASTVTCRKGADNAKDPLMEAGSVKSGSSGRQTPEPVETCGFCFPEASPAVQETRACHRTYQLGMHEDTAIAGIARTENAGTTPTAEDGRLQIICSPSQEKMQVT
uniref:TACI cysteine-rich domain-containing protein n=1 Tax=Salvator merianae TaxID=96440 RepID=A0A8D0E3B9_SALMN